MPVKYFAQILLEVELSAESNLEAQAEAETLSFNVRGRKGEKITDIINTHIIQSPSDEEFLESLCIK